LVRLQGILTHIRGFALQRVLYAPNIISRFCVFLKIRQAAGFQKKIVMENKDSREISVPTVTTWLITLLISAIPVINLIMLFVWSFNKRTDPGRRNWAKAMLILLALCLILGIVTLSVFGTVIYSFLNSGPDFVENPVY